MTTIQKTVDIPPDHRLRLDLPIPKDIPAGRAEIQVIITPFPPTSSTRRPFEGLAGSLKNSVIFGRDGVELQREMRDEW
ncbi:MAG: hypothetical protein FWE88_02110 [Phycisphaerae bacterium]|nr:hypothetical protein [Phycisphaerae bacterium]